jgi:hypothetical protein
MVNNSIYRVIFIMLLCFYAFSLEAEVKVQAQVKGNGSFENQPSELLITISRDEGEDVELKSFQLEGKKIEVEEVGSGRQSSISIINGVRKELHQITSTYIYHLQGKARGLQVVPPISVQVGGKTYKSAPVTYSVAGIEQDENFRLESEADIPSLMFPGSRGKLIYRIYFIDNVELSRQELPMMGASGFKKVGEMQSETTVNGETHILTLTQEIEALSPGSYDFPLSFIEGRNYTSDIFGRRRYKRELLRATAPPRTVVVEPFPTKNKPAGFNGAVGEYEISARLLNVKEIMVGDKIEVEVKIAGEGSFETVSLPPLKTIPGIEKNFRYSDLPPAGKVEGPWIRFIIELRALNSDVNEIPPIPLAFFNPKTKSYETVESVAIPIQVIPIQRRPDTGMEKIAPEKKEESQKGKANPSSDTSQSEGDRSWRPKKIQIRGNYPLLVSELNENEHFSISSLVYLPIMGFGLLLQLIVKRGRARRDLRQQGPKVEESKILFDKALLLEGSEDEGMLFQSIEKAFLVKFMENGVIGSEINSIRKIPSNRLPESIKLLFNDIEAFRFSGGSAVAKEAKKREIIERARMEFSKLGGRDG